MYYTQSKTEWIEDRWLVPLIPFRQTLTESTNRKRLYKLTETERVLGFIPDKWDEQYKLSLHTFLSTITKKKERNREKVWFVQLFSLWSTEMQLSWFLFLFPYDSCYLFHNRFNLYFQEFTSSSGMCNYVKITSEPSIYFTKLGY